MYSAATTVDEYLDELSEDRRASMETVRKVILDNILRDTKRPCSSG